MSSIGVHVLGGNPNSASVISGKYGNSFDSMKAAIKLPGKGFRWVNASKSSVPGRQGIPKKEAVDMEGEVVEAEFEDLETSEKVTGKSSQGQQQQPKLDEFTKALAKAMKVTMDPLGAIAAYGLHVAGMQARQFRAELEEAEAAEKDASDDAEKEIPSEAQDDEDGSLTANEDEGQYTDEPEEAVDDADEDEANMEEAADPAYEGVAERAMLTEAAYLTFLELKPEKCKKLGYLQKVSTYVQKYSRTCGQAGTFIFPDLMAPALRATMANVKQQRDGKPNETGTDLADIMTVGYAGFGPRLDANKESIIEELTTTFGVIKSEAYNDEINNVISKGLRIPGPIIAKVAENDLTDMVRRAKLLPGQETDLETAIEDENSNEYLYDAMAQRALIGEAMLEAILDTPADVQREEGILTWLKRGIKLIGGADSEESQEESFWKVLKIGWKIGRTIYKVATEKAPGDEEDPEVNTGGDFAPDDGDDWDSFITRQTGAVATT
jgi:hypothetical protein